MRVWITRTSAYSDEQPLAESYGLKEGSKPHYDRRTFASFEEYEQRLGEPFTAKGADHKTTTVAGRPGICRTLAGVGWFLEVETLADLISSLSDFGECVIKMGPDGIELEIYDDYRE